MFNRDKAVELIKANLNNPAIAQAASEMLTFAFFHGYCEATEVKDLVELLKPLTCPYCYRAHSLELCESYGVDEYRKLGKEAWEKKYIG
jgi:hypothetical protein